MMATDEFSIGMEKLYCLNDVVAATDFHHLDVAVWCLAKEPNGRPQPVACVNFCSGCRHSDREVEKGVNLKGNSHLLDHSIFIVDVRAIFHDVVLRVKMCAQSGVLCVFLQGNVELLTLGDPRDGEDETVGWRQDEGLRPGIVQHVPPDCAVTGALQCLPLTAGQAASPRPGAEEGEVRLAGRSKKAVDRRPVVSDVGVGHQRRLAAGWNPCRPVVAPVGGDGVGGKVDVPVQEAGGGLGLNPEGQAGVQAVTQRGTVGGLGNRGIGQKALEEDTISGDFGWAHTGQLYPGERPSEAEGELRSSWRLLRCRVPGTKSLSTHSTVSATHKCRLERRLLL